MDERPHQTLAFPHRVGRCIYCGTTIGPLSDEHVVPYGLNGRWVLKEASCKRHADVTSDFEREVLRDGLEAFRAVLGMKTRRPKRRRKAYPFRLRNDKKDTLVDLPTAQHPGAFCFPLFAPAGKRAKSGLHPTFPVERFVPAYKKAQMAESIRNQGTHVVGIPFPDVLAFARLLAKVSYCVAVVAHGVDECLTLPILDPLLEPSEGIFNFVGNDPDVVELTNKTVLHDIKLESRPLRARVRPLGEFGMPEYLVYLDPQVAVPKV